LHLITQTTSSFTHQLFGLLNVTESVADNVTKVKKLYDITNIPNQIPDGTDAFPGEEQLVNMGISVEFRYPD
jgi:hypothetical protein